MNDLVELTRLRFTITAHSGKKRKSGCNLFFHNDDLYHFFIENLDCNELTKLHQMFEGLKNLLLPVVTVSFQIEASIILGTTIQYFPEFPEDIFLMDNLLTGLKQLKDKDTLCSILLALGEVASSNLKRRDYLWFRDVESLLISLPAETEIRRAMLKALYSHLELKPLPTPISLTTLLPLLSSALEGTDIMTTGNAIFVLGYLLEQHCAEIIRAYQTLPQTLISLMLHTSKEVVCPSILAVGSIIFNDDYHTQMMIDVQVIPSLLWLVDYPDKGVQGNAVWVLSNIAAGNELQIQAIIDSGVIPKVKIFMHEYSTIEQSPLIENREKKKKVQKDRFHESVWLIVNVCMNSSPTQVQYLLNEHLLDALCEVLQHNKVLRHPIVAAVVESFEKMIKQAVTNIEDGLPDILTPFLKRYNLKQLFDELDDLPFYVTGGNDFSIKEMIAPFL